MRLWTSRLPATPFLSNIIHTATRRKQSNSSLLKIQVVFWIRPTWLKKHCMYGQLCRCGFKWSNHWFIFIHYDGIIFHKPLWALSWCHLFSLCLMYVKCTLKFKASYTFFMIDWLIEWMNDWLIDWLIWLTDWLIDWFDWLIAWLIDCLIDWLIAWLLDVLIDWLIAWLIDWLIDCIGGFLYICLLKWK